MRQRYALQKAGAGHIQAHSGKTEEDFLKDMVEADAVVIADVSGSMGISDAGEDGKTERWAILVKALDKTAVAQKIVIVAFSEDAQVVWGEVPRPNSTTNLAGALRYVREFASGDMKYVVISDGEPDDEKAALIAARDLGPISTIFCGPRNGSGQKFLERLATVTKGRHRSQPLTSADQLSETVQTLLLAGPRS